MVIKRILLGGLLLIGVNLFGQDCKDYKWKKCEGYGNPYTYSGQSKSAFFEKGQKSTININAFSGFEYCISLCADKNLEGIYFRIFEDSFSRTLLYDSSIEEIDYLQKQFYVENAKKLIIEVIVPESADPESETYENRTGCVGILIEYNKVPKKGF